MHLDPLKPQPGSRWQRLSLISLFPLWLTYCLLILTLTAPTLARETRVPYQEYNISPAFRRLAAEGLIEVDRRDPPPRPAKRQTQDDASSTQRSPPVRTTDSANGDDEDGEPTSTSNPTTLLTAISTSSSSATALPSPFDTSLGSNFTSQSCPTFFSNFLNNASFQECHPTSLLLQNSNSFFQTSSSGDLLDAFLDASCAASLAQCSPLMASLASDLIQDSNCGSDYRRGNPLVEQARAGLIAYEPVYRATCWKNKETNHHCFRDAFTNSTSPCDSWPYYLALGTELPGACRPTCDQCLVDVMDVFAKYAAMENQPISTTYTEAAEQINLGCGPGFINTTVPIASIAGASSTVASLTTVFPVLAAVFTTYMTFI